MWAGLYLQGITTVSFNRALGLEQRSEQFNVDLDRDLDQRHYDHLCGFRRQQKTCAVRLEFLSESDHRYLFSGYCQLNCPNLVESALEYL